MKPIRFGTDGVRGPAGAWPLDEAGCFQIGLALAAWAGGPVAVGRDPRESGPGLAAALSAGLQAGGVDAVDAGVLPTAALSCLVAARPALRAGAMLTASHNDWPDNGVKVLCADGRKLVEPAPLEAWMGRAPQPGGGRARVEPDPLGPWFEALPAVDLRGLRVLVDAAHGAAWACAPEAFRRRGAAVVERGCAPDGRNINAGVGALHPPSADALEGCDLAVCLDGDADRLLLVDAVQGPFDGDDLLGLLAADIDGPVVGTIMTNGGLEAALGGRLVRAAVGDRHVAAMMEAQGARLGGESSGHILLGGGMPSGDGTAAALAVLRACARGGRFRPPLPPRTWARLPQEHRSLPVRAQDPALIAGLAGVAAAQAADHRCVVRYSGTEARLRVMVEGPAARAWAERITEEILRRDAAPAPETP